jgi:hypothetical protein
MDDAVAVALEIAAVGLGLSACSRPRLWSGSAAKTARLTQPRTTGRAEA